MKKLATVGALVLAVLMTGAAAAQSPPSAATVLANVQKFYANASKLTAAFRQTVTIATFSISKVSDGKLWVVKPTFIRLDYMAKRSGNAVVTKTFAFAGTTLWIVDHDNKQIIQSHAGSSALPVAVSFLSGGTALSSQFKAALHAQAKDFVLELTPNQPSAQYKQLSFVVDPSNWRVKASIVVGSNGDTNRFDFYTPDLTSAIKTSWFQVNPSNLPTYKLVQPAPAPSGSAARATPTTNP
jgi:outer membrane lipoprotein-sorting protein